MNLSAAQLLRADALLWQCSEREAVHAGNSLSPVIGVALEHDLPVAIPPNELERPGAIGRLAQSLSRDASGADVHVEERAEQDPVRLGEMNNEGERVLGLERL